MNAKFERLGCLTESGQLDQTHDVDAHALRRLDQAGPTAVSTFLVSSSLQRGQHALTGHFNDAEGAGLENLGPRAVTTESLAKRLLDIAAVPFFLHVDEVVDDHAAEVAEPQLTG